MKTKSLLLIALLCLFTISFAQEATSWRGGTNGIYEGENLLSSWPESGPEILWSFESLGEGHSSPVFSNKHIFVSSMIGQEGVINILNLQGKEIKKYVYGEEFFESFPGARSTPVIAGDWLYIYSGKGVIYAFEAMSGTLRWKKDILSETDGENIKWGVTETLVVDGDVLYCSPGGKTNNVVAINRMNGNILWSSPGLGDLSAYCTPVIVPREGRKLLVTMMASHIIGLDAANGKVLWSFEQPNQWSVHANTPIVNGNSIICTSGYGRGTVCLNLSADGSSIEKAWFNDQFDNRIGGVVCINDHLYGSGDKNRGWYCIDAKTGESKWHHKELGNGVTIAADGLLFLYSDRGELLLAKVSPTELNITGKVKVEKGSAQHWAHPVIHENILYLRHGNALIAYKIAQ